jgi:hypothetical protein
MSLVHVLLRDREGLCALRRIYARSGGFMSVHGDLCALGEFFMCVHGDLAGSRRFLRAQEGSHAVHKFILGQRDP